MWSGERLTRKQLTSRPDHLRPELCTKLEEMPSWRRSKSGPMKNRNSIMQEYYEEFISLTLRTRNSKKPSRMLARNLKRQWLPLCLARWARTIRIGATRGKSNEIKIKLVFFWSQWIHKTAYGKLDTAKSRRPYCRKRGQFTAALQFGAQIYSYAPKPWKFLQQKQQWIKNGKNGKDSGVELDESQK